MMTQLTDHNGPPSVATSRTGTTPRQVLVIVCAGVVLASLDLFIVNVALPQIARDLHATNLSELSWVLNGYAIVYASLLVFFGRLADGYRRDRGFLLGVAIFTIASAACAASTTVGMLIAFRLVQAAGAALLTPTSLGLVLASYEPERRHGAVRAWTAVGGLAAALGPVVGGLLVAVDWRLVFLVNVPIGIIALVVGWRRLPHVPGESVERPDPLGVILITTGVAALTFGLVKGSDWGWGSSSILAALLSGVVLILLFVLHCLTSRTPLIHPSLFRSRQFTGASLVAVAFSASFGAMLLSIVLWEQGAWGWSALRSGLSIAPGPLMVPLFSFLVAGRLIARWGPAVVIGLGSAAFGVGVGWWAIAVTMEPNYVSGLLGGMILTGIGVGLTLVGGQPHVSFGVHPDMSVGSVFGSVLGPTSPRVDVVLQPVAGSVDRDDVAVVEQAVEDGRGEYVVAEHLSPLTWNWHTFVRVDLPCWLGKRCAERGPRFSR
jgi:EmrB/QacA subfamily drug resistance transporter